MLRSRTTTILCILLWAHSGWSMEGAQGPEYGERHRDYTDDIEDEWNWALDWSFVGASAGISIGMHYLQPNGNAVFGPRVEDVEAGRRPASISKETSGSTIPTQASVATFLSMSGLAIGLSGLGVDEQRPFYQHAVMGFFETLLFTHIITEGSKLSFGRLRPHFIQEFEANPCSRSSAGENGCTDALRYQYLDTQKSFISGHSSNAMAMATYGFLVLGERFLWGVHRGTKTQKWLARMAQIILISSAVLVGYSRIADNKHHATDVLAGLAVGAGTANIFFFRHRSRLLGRKRHMALGPTFGPHRIGLSFQLAF